MEWINVKDRLPAPLHYVLVYIGSGGAFIAWMDLSENWFDDERGINIKVTHWMELPKPPAE